MLNEEDLRQIQSIATALKNDVAARQDRAVETIAAEISAVRTDLATKIETLVHRFETIAPAILGTGAQLLAVTRGLDQVLAAHGKTTGDQAATQRAVDQLAARVAKLEREIHPEQ